MSISKYTIVSYDGIDLGAVYLEDIGKRSQLGGGEQFEIGQDIVINSGDSIALVNSGDVLLSLEKGTLNEYGPTGMGGQGGFSFSDTDDLSGITGLYRSGVTGPDKKADPENTIGDF